MADVQTTNCPGDRDARLPITHGNLLDFPRDPIACMRRLQGRHGDIAALRDGRQQIVFVFSPEHNKAVLSDARRFHSQFFAVRGPRKSSHRRVTSGLLSMNGDQHREHRRLVMAPFQKKVLARYHDTICQHTRRMLDDWRVGQVRDMADEMTRFMLRVTSAILFGVDDPEFSWQIGTQIDRWVHQNHETGMGALLSDQAFLARYDVLLGMADSLEQDVLRMIELRRASSRPPTDVLSLLLGAYDDDGQVDDQTLSGHVALLFGAAHLTTAHTFAWTLFLLAQHPDVMQQVTSELELQVAGTVPTYEEIGRLRTLDHVLRESMRVLPASAYSQRISAEPAELGPFHLPVGTPVIFSQFMTHHRADLYENPHRFHPGRWETIAPSAYEYLPFGAGPRMCIGASLAMLELKSALVMILKRFRLVVESGATIDGRVISTMLGPTGMVPMRVCDHRQQYRAAPVLGTIHDLVELPAAAVWRASGRRAA